MNVRFGSLAVAKYTSTKWLLSGAYRSLRGGFTKSQLYFLSGIGQKPEDQPMCHRHSCLVVFLLLFGAHVSTAEANDSTTDATMKRIYAEYGGKFHGDTHYRGVGGESGWTTSTHDVTCTQ